MTYFLDSNILIYSLKGTYPKLTSQILEIGPDQIKLPSMVKAELLRGARKSQYPRTLINLQHFLAPPYEIVPFDAKASEVFAEIYSHLEKKGQLIGPFDFIIAATVLSHGGTLVTHNTREFRRISGLKLEDWTR